MQLSDLFIRLGQENFEPLLRSISLGRLRLYQMFDPLKTRLHLHKLNAEHLRKAAPKIWDRLQQDSSQDLATELSQAILISHMDMIKAVLDQLGVPHEEGFFAKNVDVSGHLKEGWQQQAWDGFHEKFPPAPLLFYINHLGWEVLKAEDVFRPGAAPPPVAKTAEPDAQKPESAKPEAAKPETEEPRKSGAPKPGAPQMSFFD